MEFLVIWIIGMILGGVIASNKGRSAIGWVLICGLLTPLAVLVLLALPNLRVRRAAAAVEAGSKACPQCAESVKAAAKVCRFCGHEFSTGQPSSRNAGAEAARLNELWRKSPSGYLKALRDNTDSDT